MVPQDQPRAGHGSKVTVPVIWLDKLGRGDVASVGGKNASLGEMLRHLGSQGIKVPPGFATTAEVYWRFIDANRLGALIATKVAELKAGKATATETGSAIRAAILRGEWPEDLAHAIGDAYRASVEAARPGRGGGSGPLERHGRGPAGGKLRRPAGEFPEYPGQSRAARRLPPLPGLALHQPRHQLPGGQGLRPPEGGPFGRRAAHGAIRPRRRRRDVLHRHRDGL